MLLDANLIVILAIGLIVVSRYSTSRYNQIQPFRYREYGRRDLPTVVIIPGLDGATAFFQDVLPELTVQNHVVVFELPWSSSNSTREYSFDYISSELKSVLEELHIQKASIIGESFGGICAQNFAYLYPSSTEKLILLSSLASLSLPPEVAWKQTLLLPLKLLGTFFPALAQV
jgi:pimeloyl-ACP methyl ester carboxylesterase